MNHTQKVHLPPESNSPIRVTKHHKSGYSAEDFPPLPPDSEAWGLHHKRLILYFAIYTALITSLMMLFL